MVLIEVYNHWEILSKILNYFLLLICSKYRHHRNNYKEHHRDATNKIQTMGNYIKLTDFFPVNKLRDIYRFKRSKRELKQLQYVLHISTLILPNKL